MLTMRLHVRSLSGERRNEQRNENQPPMEAAVGLVRFRERDDTNIHRGKLPWATKLIDVRLALRL